jgi:hypothetical protein
MDKKYKYTVKKFAKLLTVHPDKKVTLEDEVDLRAFINPQDGLDKLGFNALTDLVAAVAFDEASLWNYERSEYWPNLVEHGEMLTIANQQFDPPPVMILSVGEPRFKVRVLFELNPEKVAAWLAATGFPQISHAKENPDAASNA